MTNLDPTQNITIPEKPKTLVSSSAITGYSYDAQNFTLDVWYKGKKPSLYRYFLVYPNVMSSIFDQGGSIGLKARNNLKELRSIKLL